MAKSIASGGPDGFQFNISVGYDLAGIKTEKVNSFIDNMMEAGATEIPDRNRLPEGTCRGVPPCYGSGY